MTVTVRIDDELRQKSYWAKTQDSQTFTYLRDREGGIAILKDGAGRMVSCVKDKVVFPMAIDPVSQLVEAVTDPAMTLSECLDTIDELTKQEETSTKEI
jgi:hypothetical protein